MAPTKKLTDGVQTRGDTGTEIGVADKEGSVPYKKSVVADIDSVVTVQTERSQNEGVQLKRELGLFSAVNLIVGVMIGSGIFISPTSALERSGSVGLCLVVWLICGVISLLGALAFAELGTVVPRSGSEYAYFQEAFGNLHRFWGPLPSFIASWVYVLVLRPAEVAVITLTFSEYLIQPFASHMAGVSPESLDIVKKLIAMIALATMTYVNFMSVKLYVRLQNIFATCKLVACLVVIIGGIYQISIGNTANLNQGFKGSSASPKDLALAFYSGLWAYDGWSAVTIVTEEIKRPEVNIPRSISIGVPLITVLYVMMNVAYMTVLTIPEMIAAPAVAVAFGDRILGPMNFIIPLGVAISTFGCALSIQFSTTRLCYVAGRDGNMVEAFSYVHTRRLTPAPAVTMQGIIAFLFIIIGNITTLIDFASFLIWIFYGFAMVALLVMRRTKPHLHRPYKVPIIIPVFIIVVALFLAIVPIITDPSPGYFFAIGFILLGVAIYTPFVYYKYRPKCMDSFTYVVQVMMEAVPPEEKPESVAE